MHEAADRRSIRGGNSHPRPTGNRIASIAEVAAVDPDAPSVDAIADASIVRRIRTCADGFEPVEKRARVREVVINTSHLPEQFPAALGDGARGGLHIQYSHEGPQSLETGGGMLRALPLLDDAPFTAVNADICCNVDFSTLPQESVGLAHLLMVDNPPRHPLGDFVLHDGLLHDKPKFDLREARAAPVVGAASAARMSLTFPLSSRLAVRAHIWHFWSRAGLARSDDIRECDRRALQGAMVRYRHADLGAVLRNKG